MCVPLFSIYFASYYFQYIIHSPIFNILCAPLFIYILRSLSSINCASPYFFYCASPFLINCGFPFSEYILRPYIFNILCVPTFEIYCVSPCLIFFCAPILSIYCASASYTLNAMVGESLQTGEHGVSYNQKINRFWRKYS